jgi:hypothetical protein
VISPAPTAAHLRTALGIATPWEPIADRSGPPWFVRIALGAVAWLAGSFLLGFVAWIVGEEGALPVGILLLACGIAARWLAPAFLRDLWLQASLLAMVAGRGAIGIGAAELWDEQAAFFVLFCVELVTLAMYPGRGPRLVSAFCALCWLAAGIGHPWATELIAVAALAASAAGSELEAHARRADLGWLWEPVTMASGLWALAGLAGASPDWPGSHPWLAATGIAGIAAAIATRWLREAGAGTLTWAAAAAAAAALGTLGASVPGTLAGLLCTALAFRRRSPLWLAAALAATLAHGVYLYWQMHGSFAAKGAAMVGLGLVLLAIAALAHRRSL